MINVLQLGKLLAKNYFSEAFMGGKRSKWNKLLYLLIIIGFLPTIISLFFLSREVTLALNTLNQGFYPISLALIMITFLMLFTNFMMIPSTLFLSSDLQTLLPLPIKSSVLVVAKLLISVVLDYVLMLMLIIPWILGYYSVVQPTLVFTLILIVTLILLPLIPTVIAGILTMIILRFAKFFRNQDRFMYLSMIMILGLSLSISIIPQQLSNLSQTELMNLLFLGNNSLSNVMTRFLPFLIPAINSLKDTSFLWFGFYLLLNVGFAFGFITIINWIYIDILTTIQTANVTRKQLNSKTFAAQLNSKGVRLTIINNDWRMLVRTPIYLLNCVLTPFLVPVMLLFITIFGSGSDPEVQQMMNYLKSLPPSYTLFAILGLAIGIISTSMSTISVTAVTRDAKHLDMIRTLPISLNSYFESKLLLGIIHSLAGSAGLVIMANIILPLGVIGNIVILVETIIGVICFNALGLLLDSVRPKLLWENETVAVKQNLNVLIMIFVGFVFCAGLFLVYSTFLKNTLVTYLSVGVINVLLVILILIAVKGFRKFIQRLN